MCQKVEAAVRELEKEYEGKIRVTVAPVDTDDGRAAVHTYGWKGPGHGLVTFDATGAVVGNLPGHSYGKAEIKTQVERLLAGS